MDQLADIASFHNRFQQSYDGPPRLLTGDLRRFRLNFLAEELSELATSLGVSVTIQFDNTAQRAPNLHDAFDALIDIDYVLKGTTYLMGLASAFPEGWRRVHEANMMKRLAENEHDSKRAYRFDVVKPPGWTPPTLSDLLSR